MSIKTEIIERIQHIENEPFLKALLAMVSEYQKTEGQKVSDKFSKQYTREAYNEHITDILNDVEAGKYLTQKEMEDESENW